MQKIQTEGQATGALVQGNNLNERVREAPLPRYKYALETVHNQRNIILQLEHLLGDIAPGAMDSVSTAAESDNKIDYSLDEALSIIPEHVTYTTNRCTDLIEDLRRILLGGT